MDGNMFHLYWVKSFLILNYLCRTPDITAVGTIINVFSYDAVSGWDSNISTSRKQADAYRVSPQSQVEKLLCEIILEPFPPRLNGRRISQSRKSFRFFNIYLRLSLALLAKLNFQKYRIM